MRVFSMALLFVLAACGEPGDGDGGTLGEEGRVEFSYRRNCFFGCPLGQPLLTGTRQTVGVSGPGDAEGVGARSGDEDLLDVFVERTCFCEPAHDSGDRIEIDREASCDGPFRKRCDNDVLVEAKGAGDTFLELVDGDGDSIDRVLVQIRDAERARFFATFADRIGAREGTEFEMGADDTVDIELELFDDEGRKLLAPEGVTWSSEDESVATVVAWLIGGGAEVSAGSQISVVAQAPGETRVGIDVPGIRQSVSIKVSE